MAFFVNPKPPRDKLAYRILSARFGIIMTCNPRVDRLHLRCAKMDGKRKR